MSTKDELQAQLISANQLLSKNNLVEMESVLFKIFEIHKQIEDKENFLEITFGLGALYIDLATELIYEKKYPSACDNNDRGIELLKNLETSSSEKEIFPTLFYNLANGYSNLLRLELNHKIGNGIISENYTRQKDYLRKAIEVYKELDKGNFNQAFICELYTNYGNCLDSMKRNIEALDFYNKALSINPDMPNALGNKAIVLMNLAFSIRGYTHLYTLEAKRLFERALKSNSLDTSAKRVFSSKLDSINDLIRNHHDGMVVEEIDNPEPKNEFHEFIMYFYTQHELFLTPTVSINRHESLLKKDSLFPSSFTCSFESNDTDDYIRFFNQIKQDYIFARYLLAQSQYRTKNIDIIDEDVALYYPLDYTVYSSYAQMMRVSLRLSFDILDKIASFVRFFYKLTYPKNTHTYFRNIWQAKGESNKLQEKLLVSKNFFLLALFDLSKDINSNSCPGFSFMKKRRHALTHRFISLYDIAIDSNKNSEDFISIDDFRDECIKTLQTVRSAIFYLVQMIEVEERKKTQDGNFAEFPMTKLNSSLRWRPIFGEVE